MSDRVVLSKTNWSRNPIKTIDEKFMWRQVGPTLVTQAFDTELLAIPHRMMTGTQ